MRASYNRPNVSTLRARIIADMKMRASYNVIIIGTIPVEIIADMKMRGTYPGFAGDFLIFQRKTF